MHATNCKCEPCIRREAFDAGYKAGRDNELKRTADVQQALARSRMECEELRLEVESLHDRVLELETNGTQNEDNG